MSVAKLIDDVTSGRLIRRALGRYAVRGFQKCEPFCRQTNAPRHCFFCKCKACSFCAGELYAGRHWSQFILISKCVSALDGVSYARLPCLPCVAAPPSSLVHRRRDLDAAASFALHVPPPQPPGLPPIPPPPAPVYSCGSSGVQQRHSHKTSKNGGGKAPVSVSGEGSDVERGSAAPTCEAGCRSAEAAPERCAICACSQCN